LDNLPCGGAGVAKDQQLAPQTIGMNETWVAKVEKKGLNATIYPNFIGRIFRCPVLE
jgi:hypothetical protein